MFTNIAFYLTLFLAAVLYYTVNLGKRQYMILLIFSAVWYAYYAKIYSLYLAATILTTWLSAIIIDKTSHKKLGVTLGIVFNIGVLAVLKYNGLFFDGLNLVVPLGISFYTFQAVGYCIDVYRETQTAETNLLKHSLFLGFAPQLICGPISRKSDIAEGMFAVHKFDYDRTVLALYRICWGLFKKIVIADNIALLVNRIYENAASVAGIWLLLNMFLYLAQLFSDFSGCIDIACGTAKLFGINLPENFNRPFAAKSISEFWRRWHITLGAWMKDYLFYPLLRLRSTAKLQKLISKKISKKMGRKISTWCCLFVLWTTVGFWHGADLKYFIGNGMLYFTVIVLGELFEPLFAKLHDRLHINTKSSWYELFRMVRTFLIVSVGNLYFSISSTSAANSVLVRIFTAFLDGAGSLKESLGVFYGREEIRIVIGLIMTLYLVVISLLNKDCTSWLRSRPAIIRWCVYFMAIVIIFVSFLLQNGGYGEMSNFIYMQF